MVLQLRAPVALVEDPAWLPAPTRWFTTTPPAPSSVLAPDTHAAHRNMQAKRSYT